MKIDNKVEPPDKKGMTPGGTSNWSDHAHLGGLRTGSTTISATNGTPAKVGAVLQDGLWKFLGITRPEPSALPAFVFGPGAPPASPAREIETGIRSCKKDMVLFQTGDVRFCAPKRHGWPATIGYALVSDTPGFEPAGARIAHFASRLSGVRFEPSHKPSLLVVLSDRELTDDSFAALLRAKDVDPEKAMIQPLDLKNSLAKSTEKAMGKVVGKPIAALVASFMSTKSSSYATGSEPMGSSLIGLHNRKPADTESAIQDSFFDLLDVTLPAYDLPDACAAAAPDGR